MSGEDDISDLLKKVLIYGNCEKEDISKSNVTVDIENAIAAIKKLFDAFMKAVEAATDALAEMAESINIEMNVSGSTVKKNTHAPPEILIRENGARAPNKKYRRWWYRTHGKYY